MLRMRVFSASMIWRNLRRMTRLSGQEERNVGVGGFGEHAMNLYRVLNPGHLGQHNQSVWRCKAARPSTSRVHGEET